MLSVKSEKGSVLILVIATLLFIVVMLTSTFVTLSISRKSQLDDNGQIKALYENDVDRVGEIYNTITGEHSVTIGNGTESSPYEIYYIEDLVNLSNQVNSGNNFANKYFKLIRDLDFNDDNSYKYSTSREYGDLNGDGITNVLKTELIIQTGKGFECIGGIEQSTNTLHTFDGIFNGNGHNIMNIYINSTNQYVGLFGYVSNLGIVKNLKLVNGDINATQTVGSISGYNAGTILLCHNDNTIINCTSSNNTHVGGITGKNEGIIELCSNSGEISANSINSNSSNVTLGGIAGQSCGENAIVRYCFNGGNLNLEITSATTDSVGVGGIVAENTSGAKVENCYNFGSITASRNENNTYLGGIIAWEWSSEKNTVLSSSYNYGTINFSGTGTGNIGGCVAILSTTYCSMQNCYLLSSLGLNVYGDNNGTVTNSSTKTQSELQNITSTLNNSQTVTYNSEVVNVWKNDENSQNNGYPVLFWQ